jgi:hypothetical protein
VATYRDWRKAVNEWMADENSKWTDYPEIDEQLQERVEQWEDSVLDQCW